MQLRRLVTSLLGFCLVLAARVSAENVWTVPGIVNAGGLNGTRFVSDLALSNPGRAAAEVAISFLPSATSNVTTVTVRAGETIVYRNVVDSVFHTSGAGALSISSAQPFLIRARTYNTASSGTYGLALPVYESDRLLTAGERGDSLWISQDASSTSGYRTNIAVVFPDESGGEALVTVFDADGNERGRQVFSLASAGFQQFSVGSFAGSVAVGRARIQVTSGRAAGYAVVVDNVTGDGSLFTFDDLPGGTQDVLVNGVARANGRNATFFRTDGRFYNPTDTDATVTVSFHANGNSNPSPATASFALPAGKVRDVVDVLDALLGLPVGSAGALRIRSEWPVAVLFRTSNVDPSGARPGTFGAQQKAVPVLSFLSSADAGASVTGIRQDASFRTNVGFAAGADGARYALTLATAGGATVATASGSLGSWGWTQPNVQDLFPGVSVPPDATLGIRVTEGSLDAFDSSIDNASGDSVVTPIALLPSILPTSATIGPAGGSIRSDDGRMTLEVPAGALASPVALSFQTTTNDAPQGTGAGYRLSPSGITFARPALLTLRYGRAETDGSSAEALAIVSRAGADWRVLGDGTVDAARHTLTVPLPATSPVAVSPPSRVRAAAADPDTGLAVVQSWAMRPAGKWAVLTGKRISLSVYAVGPPSSRSARDFVTGKLSTSPYEVEAIWFVNNTRNGTSADGIILHEGAGGTLSVQYLAPNCPPPPEYGNPVSIYAAIRNTGGFFRQWYQPRGIAWVRVLSREWLASAEWTIDQQCRGTEEILDRLVYKGEIAFALDDGLHITGGAFKRGEPPTGTPSGCSGLMQVLRTSVPDFNITTVLGSYNAANETFDMTLSGSFPVRSGYSWIESDGKTPGSSESGTIPRSMSLSLQRGPNPKAFTASYLLSFSLEIKPKLDCP